MTVPLQRVIVPKPVEPTCRAKYGTMIQRIVRFVGHLQGVGALAACAHHSDGEWSIPVQGLSHTHRENGNG
jgi:hypothetical protein